MPRHEDNHHHHDPSQRGTAHGAVAAKRPRASPPSTPRDDSRHPHHPRHFNSGPSVSAPPVRVQVGVSAASPAPATGNASTAVSPLLGDLLRRLEQQAPGLAVLEVAIRALLHVLADANAPSVAAVQQARRTAARDVGAMIASTHQSPQGDHHRSRHAALHQLTSSSGSGGSRLVCEVYGSGRTGLATATTSDLDFVVAVMPVQSAPSPLSPQESVSVAAGLSLLLQQQSSGPSSNGTPRSININGLTRNDRKKEAAPIVRALLSAAARYRPSYDAAHAHHASAGGGPTFSAFKPIIHAKIPLLKCAHAAGPEVDLSFALDGAVTSDYLLRQLDTSHVGSSTGSSSGALQAASTTAAARGLIILMKQLLASAASTTAAPQHRHTASRSQAQRGRGVLSGSGAAPLVAEAVQAALAGTGGGGGPVRGANDPSVGGLGSFPLALMVLWFLVAERATEHASAAFPPSMRASYATQLLRLLEYYGSSFDHTAVGISLGSGAGSSGNSSSGGPSAFQKPPSAALFIRNPVAPEDAGVVNAASACTRYGAEIRPYLRRCHAALMAAVGAFALPDTAAGTKPSPFDPSGGGVETVVEQCAAVVDGLFPGVLAISSDAAPASLSGSQRAAALAVHDRRREFSSYCRRLVHQASLPPPIADTAATASPAAGPHYHQNSTVPTWVGGKGRAQNSALQIAAPSSALTGRGNSSGSSHNHKCGAGGIIHDDGPHHGGCSDDGGLWSRPETLIAALAPASVDWDPAHRLCTLRAFGGL